MKHLRNEVKDWRRFELLIAKLENVLARSECIVRSPDHLMDHEIQRLREVDASITYVDNNTSRVISVECRRRTAKQDVTWIEQLATKKTALQLDCTIAVASTGFSEAAYRKAAHHGIVLKTYREATLAAADAPLWLFHSRRTWKLLEVSYETAEGGLHPSPQQQRTAAQLLSEATTKTPILRNIETGETIALESIIEALMDGTEFRTDKPQRKFRLTFATPTTLVVFPNEIVIAAIRLGVSEEVVDRPMDNTLFGKYEGANAEVMEVATGVVDCNDQTLRFEVIFQTEADS